MPHVVEYKRFEYDGKPLKEFVCGWSAALISILITYPLDKLIFRQVLEGLYVKQALHQLKFEGLWYLYRGFLPPLIQRTGHVSIMYGVYEVTQRPLLAHGVDPLVAQLLSSGISGLTVCVLTPFERVMVILADKKYYYRFDNTAHVFRSLRHKHDFAEFYRGFVPILLRNAPATVIYFVVEKLVREHIFRLHEVTSKWRKSLNDFLIGAFLGAGLSTLFFPINVARIQIQSKIGGKYENVFKVLVEVYNKRDRKLSKMFQGAQVNFLRGSLYWGCTTVAHEFIRDLMYQ